jgi:hypothetical protein
MRLASRMAIALLSGTLLCAGLATPWQVEAQTADPDDDDDDESDDGDDDSDVPDPDDESSDPDQPDDPGSDPDSDQGDGGGGPDDDPGGAPDDDGGSDAPGGDDEDGGSAAPGEGDDDDDGGTSPGAGDDDDDGGPAPGSGDDDDGATPGSGDDDDDSPAPAPGGGSGDDDDDDGSGGAPAPPGGPGTADDDDDDDAGAGSGSATAPGDDDEDESGVGEGAGTPEFVGDEEIVGGGGETEAERIALDARDGIETDREGFRYRSNEFVALDLDADDITRLRANGFELLRSDALGQAGGTVHLLRGPARIGDRDALSMIEDVADPGSLSFNHLFDSSSGRVRQVRAVASRERPACGCQVGLIDTGVANRLPSFAHISIEQRAFNGTTITPRLHGTAIAHLFAGTYARRRETTRVVVADIFSGERSSAGSTYALVRALDWLASRNLPVINVSLAGPRNSVVAATIQRLNARGHVIVAAAGNDGPAAPPVFPGAYQNVVAVTAVDERSQIYRYANRGSHVDFSARGVNVPAINARGEPVAATGTSFAAPVVAARLAMRLRSIDPAAARAAIAVLEAEAQDLGAPGRDTIYGSGLVPDAP